MGTVLVPMCPPQHAQRPLAAAPPRGPTIAWHCGRSSLPSSSACLPASPPFPSTSPILRAELRSMAARRVRRPQQGPVRPGRAHLLGGRDHAGHVLELLCKHARARGSALTRALAHARRRACTMRGLGVGQSGGCRESQLCVEDPR